MAPQSRTPRSTRSAANSLFCSFRAGTGRPSWTPPRVIVGTDGGPRPRSFAAPSPSRGSGVLVRRPDGARAPTTGDDFAGAVTAACQVRRLGLDATRAGRGSASTRGRERPGIDARRVRLRIGATQSDLPATLIDLLAEPKHVYGKLGCELRAGVDTGNRCNTIRALA